MLLRLFVLSLLCSVTLQHTINHVVVLMEENRSFDHMLGYMKFENPEINGLTGGEFNPLNVTDPSQGYIQVTPNGQLISPWDPCHALPCVTEQIYGYWYDGNGTVNNTLLATNMGFIQNAIRENGGVRPDVVMDMFTPDRVPIISTLAREFALFDTWYCSVPSDTNPNRRFIHAATADGSMDDSNYYYPGFAVDTIYDRLTAIGKSWAIYFFDWSPACMFTNLRTPYARQFFKPMSQFATDAASGNLPHYAFLAPRMWPTDMTPANDQHPDHSVAEGERLMKYAYEALRAGPLWNDTLYIITYDEHGGFYDHVPPPEGIPSPDGKNVYDPFFDFTRLGIRIPTIMISPWIEKGTLVHEANGPFANSQYEHSSVPATMKKLFGWESFLTKRDEWAGTFEHVYSIRETPRTDCPMTLPDIPAMPLDQLRAEGARKLTGLQRAFMDQDCDVPPDSPEYYPLWQPEDLETMTQLEGGVLATKRFQRFLNY